VCVCVCACVRAYVRACVCVCQQATRRMLLYLALRSLDFSTLKAAVEMKKTAGGSMSLNGILLVPGHFFIFINSLA